MKLIVLLVVAGFFAHAEGLAQKVTLSLKNASLEQVFNQVKLQTGFSFIWDEPTLKGTHPVDIHVKKAPIADVLDYCLKGQFLGYQIIGKIVVITQKQGILGSVNNPVYVIPPPVEVRGRIVNQEGEPLSNVSVLLTGTKIGTVTDAEGYFTLTAPENKDVILEVSSVGYQTKKVSIGGRTNVNITLDVDITGLSDVVVVGYGTQKKANLTGAVASISGEALENKPLPNVGEVLRGVSPNLNINLGAYGAEPGAVLGFNIRGVGSISGNSAPLILVDGVEMNINNLDPGTIESVSVLKDASSSAIYGSRAPFGVILITTKKGKRNERITIQYNNNMIFGKPIGIPHMDNSLIFATVYNQASVNAGSPPMFPDEQIERIKGFMAGTYTTEFNPDNPTTSIWDGRRFGNANYDWPHILFKDHKFDQRHNIAVSGGNDKNQYYIS